MTFAYSTVFPQCVGTCANGTQCTRKVTAFRDISGRCGTHHRIFMRAIPVNSSGIPVAVPPASWSAVQASFRAFAPNVPVPVPVAEPEPVVDPENECSICYGEICMPITCPNGHRVCGQHYQDDIASMCKHRSDNHIKCFLCRTRIDSTQFDLKFIASLPRAYLNSFPGSNSPRVEEFLGTSMMAMLKMLNYVE